MTPTRGVNTNRSAGGVSVSVASDRAVGARPTDEATRYRLLADNATDIIACYDLNGVFTFVSPAVTTVLGYEPASLVGRPAISLMSVEDAAMAMSALASLWASGADAPPIRFEYRARRKDGEWVWLEAHPRAVRDPVTGRVVGFQDVVRDVSQRKAMENDLRNARSSADKAAAIKSQFVADVSHEIRAPLSCIVGLSKLLEGCPGMDAKGQKIVARIAAASEHLHRIVDDILDLSKLEAGTLDICLARVAPAKLFEEVAEWVSPQAGAKGLGLSIRISPDVPEVLYLDKGRVRQVVLNLMSNAVKFTVSGAIELIADYDRSSQQLQVKVADTGPGLRPDQQARLFERFERVCDVSDVARGGAGLGLAISRGLIETMGGTMSVESEPGVGSSFGFAIPATEPKAPT